MEQPKCNVCGVAQNEWVNGKCYACGKGHYCDMDADMIVEQRVYDWCAKNNLLDGGTIYKANVRQKVEMMMNKGKAVPQYMQRYVFD